MITRLLAVGFALSGCYARGGWVGVGRREDGERPPSSRYAGHFPQIKTRFRGRAIEGRVVPSVSLRGLPPAAYAIRFERVIEQH
jgi:hypothetical protein